MQSITADSLSYFCYHLSTLLANTVVGHLKTEHLDLGKCEYKQVPKTSSSKDLLSFGGSTNVS